MIRIDPQKPGGAGPFGWRRPERILLTVIAGLCSLGLLRVAHRETKPISLPQFTVDLNTAPPEALLALPKLGPTLVGRIVEARETRPFRSLAELDKRVRGIGPVTIRSLRPYLKISDEPIPERRAEPKKAP